MNPQFFVLGILAICGWVVITLVKMNLEHRTPDNHDSLRDVNRRLADLEQRMANVETITTSKDYDLNKEFEELARQGK